MSLANLIDIMGTFAFAVSGAVAAMEKKFDPFGVLTIAFVTAIGGGAIRDLLLGDLPVTWLRNSQSSVVIITATVMTLIFSKWPERFQRSLLLFDALGLGLFTVVGIEKGLAHAFSPVICVALGTTTGCFGGITRDVLLNNIPLIFQKEIYATACIVGGGLFFLVHYISGAYYISSIAAIVVVILIRLLAMRYTWGLPKWYL
jgi:uncharacterized membrane protein YeiH